MLHLLEQVPMASTAEELDAQYAKLLAIVCWATGTNRLVTALDVPLDQHCRSAWPAGAATNILQISPTSADLLTS